MQSTITLTANFSSIKVLLNFYFGSCISSYLCFLWFRLYFILISHTYLLCNTSSMCLHLTIIFQNYLRCFYTISFIRFSTYINHFCIVLSTEISELFISFFTLLDSLKTSFTETNLSWLIYEAITALKIRTSIAFNLSIPNSTILSCFFFFFVTTDLYFLIPAVIWQIFFPIAELVIPKGIQTYEANADTEIQPISAEARINK